MKSLIILKGLAKTEKLGWVKREGLQDFFLDIDVLRKLYSSPELLAPFNGTLSKAFGDTVYSEFLKVLVTKLSKGCLVVLDPENECLKVFESLAFIFGYKIFYVVFKTPKDYQKNSKSYGLSYYPPKRKKEIDREINSFSEFSRDGKAIIKHYKEVEKYWENICKAENCFTIDKPILHVSDIHSNYPLYKRLPSFNNYCLTIFHGDYVDGPEEGGSRKMIEEIIRCEDKNKIWLEGNHELRLRKQLGIQWLSLGGKNREIRDILYKSIPDDYFKTTYKEFIDLTPEKAKEFLEKLNKTLKLFLIIECGNIKYVCTHAGIKYLEQLSPRYIGNVVYGNRDMNRVDRDFFNHTKGSEYWSVHAHCKYFEDWCTHKYENVVNLEPLNNEEIIYAEQHKNNWKICQVRK